MPFAQSTLVHANATCVLGGRRLFGNSMEQCSDWRLETWQEQGTECSAGSETFSCAVFSFRKLEHCHFAARGVDEPKLVYAVLFVNPFLLYAISVGRGGRQNFDHQVRHDAEKVRASNLGTLRPALAECQRHMRFERVSRWQIVSGTGAEDPAEIICFCKVHQDMNQSGLNFSVSPTRRRSPHDPPVSQLVVIDIGRRTILAPSFEFLWSNDSVEIKDVSTILAVSPSCQAR
jgi:hypothetical protein